MNNLSKYGKVEVTYPDGATQTFSDCMIVMGLNGNIAIKNSKGVTLLAASNIEAVRS